MSRIAGSALAGGLFVLLILPLLALGVSSSPEDLAAGVQHPMFGDALWLSLRTSVLSLCIIVVGGTPLAWWLSTTTSRWRGLVSSFVHLPIIIPPAVIGVALLQAFGRRGLLGGVLDDLGLALPFSDRAVVLAQVVVAAPFFVQATVAAFNKVSPEMMTVARTLGATPGQAFFRVALPVALPGLIAGASLAWARALGEFGATLLFAGNMQGETQTIPLAIFTALETDVRVAIAFSLVMAGVGIALVAGLSLLPKRWAVPPSRLRPRTFGGDA